MYEPYQPLLDWFPNMTGDFNPRPIMTPSDKPAIRAAIVAKAVSYLGGGALADECLAYVGFKPGHVLSCAFACFIIGQTLAEAEHTFSYSGLYKTGYGPALHAHAFSVRSLFTATQVSLGQYRLLPGDIMMMWDPAFKGFHHAGIIETTYGSHDLSFSSIEGEGDGVVRVHRNACDVAPDGRPKYAFIRTL